MGQKILGTIFGLVFMAAGLFFCFLVFMGFYRTVRTYSWPKVDCTITSSKIVEVSSSSIEVHVNFTYSSNGREYPSEWSRDFSDYSEAQQTLNRYPVEATVTGYMDPERPSNVMLEHKSLWSGLIILFPLVFVLAGAGIIYASLKSTPGGAISVGPKTSQALTGTIGLGCFFGIFLLVGAGILFFLFVRPVYRIYQAQHWIETPCKIISSEVASHPGDDSTTYSIEILFTYTYEGRQYKSNKYDLSAGGSSSGQSAKQKVVDALPADKETKCYVNPANPFDAVLNRGFTSNLWVGLFGLPFFLAGVGGILFVVFKGKKRVQPGAEWKPVDLAAATSYPSSQSAQMVLKPSGTPLGKFVGALIIALIWNSIVGLIGFAILSDSGAPFFAWLIIGIFGLIGLLLLANVPYQLLAMFNPRPTITITPGTVRLGDRVNVEWAFSGRTSLIEQFKIQVEGCEEARYRRGTNSYTDRNVFATIVLIESQNAMEIARGNRSLSIPEDTMHSFESDNNKIVWTIKLTGSIKNWPDISEDFPLVVQPLSISSISRG